jgi:hypothetical protein
MEDDKTPETLPQTGETYVLPGAIPFPLTPPVYCIVNSTCSGCLMLSPPSLGPVLTVALAFAQQMAAQSGGQVMEWKDAYPLLQTAPRPSLIVSPDGTPASESPKLVV